VSKSGNLLAGLPDHPLTEEQFDTLLEHGPVSIERIVSTGQTAPDTGWFDQQQDEWVCVIDGVARIEIDGKGETLLERGDWLMLPAHCRHRVVFTQTAPPTVWLAVHMYPAGKQRPV